MKTKRICFIFLAFSSAFLFLSLRLYYISTGNSHADEVLSGQYTRKIAITEGGGMIFDKNGKLLSHIYAGETAFVDPSKTKNIGETAKKLSAAGGGKISYYTEKLYSDIPFTTFCREPVDDAGVLCYKKYNERRDGFLCHLIGYRDGDGKGISGALMTYDGILRGKCAYSVSFRYAADALGGVMERADSFLDDSGFTDTDGIYLTVEKEIQEKVEDICGKHLDMGAVMITDTETGDILSVCSCPQYDRENVKSYLDSENGELVNRAFRSFTPGSVFKTIVACAALEQDKSLFYREYECAGKIEIGDTVIRCHETCGHGKITMKEAFAQSCNPYFIDLALYLGIDKITDMAKKLGVTSEELGNVDGTFTGSGSLPTKNLSYPANIANTAVGQGDVLMTPLEVCSVISCAATGICSKPVLVEKTVIKGREDITYHKRERVISEETSCLMREMLRECVENGTGSIAESDKTEIIGKTATAQSGQYKDGNEVVHRWFAGIFKDGAGRMYTACVLCDGNGNNTTHPAEIFRMIAESITNNK